MGTFLPFAIITSAMCIWHIAGTDSRLSRRPHATAGTARMGPWPRRTLGPTPDTRHSLGPPVVAWASRVVGRRPVAPVRRRARPHAAAGGAWRAGAALGRAGAGGARPGRCSVGRCRPGCWAGGPGRRPPAVPPAVARLLGASAVALGPAGRAERQAPRVRAAFPSGPAAPRVRLSRPLVPGLAGRGPASALLLAPGARPEAAPGAGQAPAGPPRGRRGRDRRRPGRLRGLPGAARRAQRGSPRRPPAPTRPRAPRSGPRQARLLGGLPGARGGGAPPPRRAGLAHVPEHAARRCHTGQAGGCGLGNVGRTVRPGVTETAPMRRRGRGRRRGPDSRGARGARARSPCPGIALLSGSMGAMRRAPPERGLPANLRH